jgi:spore maturation protein B
MDVSALVVPGILAVTAAFALGKKVDVYAALTDGAGEGLSVVLRILPALVALLSAVYMFRASGAMEFLTGLLAPVLSALGIPPETAALMLVRPVSGSGALAVGSDLMQQFGADSYIGRVAAVMLGSTETTFYTVAVYFSAAGIRKTRYTIPAALCADLAGFAFAALAVRLFFPV